MTRRSRWSRTGVWAVLLAMLAAALTACGISNQPVTSYERLLAEKFVEGQGYSFTARSASSNMEKANEPSNQDTPQAEEVEIRTPDEFTREELAAIVGEGHHTPQGPPTKPVYPERPLYPDAFEVQVDYDGRQRITSYLTSASTSDVLAFYHEELEQAGWFVHEDGGDFVVFGYVNTHGYPAFGLSVFVSTTEAGLTSVLLDHRHSGPFAPSEWPEY